MKRLTILLLCLVSLPLMAQMKTIYHTNVASASAYSDPVVATEDYQLKFIVYAEGMSATDAYISIYGAMEKDSAYTLVENFDYNGTEVDSIQITPATVDIPISIQTCDYNYYKVRYYVGSVTTGELTIKNNIIRKGR